jgi:hypothetical protein
MLRSFMIISGRGGIVLYRKVFTKSVNQPRMIAGLVTALCEYASGNIGLPIAYMELEQVAITAVEQPGANSRLDHLRCVVFHDVADGELYGRLIAAELLHAFMEEYGERLAGLHLANAEGVEDLFKGFSSRVRSAIENAVQPLMLQLEREPGIQRALLFRHRRGAFAHSPSHAWYSGYRDDEANVIADLQALLHVSDDVLVSRMDQTSRITIGDHIRIDRLSMGTLIVATAPSESHISCQGVINATTAMLQRRELMNVCPRVALPYLGGIRFCHSTPCCPFRITLADDSGTFFTCPFLCFAYLVASRNDPESISAHWRTNRRVGNYLRKQTREMVFAVLLFVENGQEIGGLPREFVLDVLYNNSKQPQNCEVGG